MNRRDLEQALEPVLADVRATAGKHLAEGWSARPVSDGRDIELVFPSGGHATRPADAGALEIAQWLSDLVQEWVIEERWRAGSNWPPCPDHPTTHPRAVEARDGELWWVCPRGAGPVARVGTLGAESRP